MWKVRIEQHDGLRQVWRSLLRFARSSRVTSRQPVPDCISVGRKMYNIRANVPLLCRYSQNSQMVHGILWISAVPNFAQIRQGVWKVRAETD